MAPTQVCDPAEKLAQPTAEAELRALRSEVKALMRAIAYVDAEAPRLDKEARAAWDAKNRKALTHARSTLVDWLLVCDDVATMQRCVAEFLEAHPDLDGGRAAELQRMVDDLQLAAGSVRRLDETVRELVALG